MITDIIQDKTGTMILNNDGKRIKVALLLKGKAKKMIGTIDLAKRTLTVNRIKAKHLLNISNSYGFNHFLLNKATRFDTIILKEKETNAKYQLDRIKLLEVGSFLFFEKQGFERQIFVSRDWIMLHRI